MFEKNIWSIPSLSYFSSPPLFSSCTREREKRAEERNVSEQKLSKLFRRELSYLESIISKNFPSLLMHVLLFLCLNIFQKLFLNKRS